MKHATLGDIQASATFRAALAEFLGALSAHSRDIQQVVVFGSVARGESGPESDVDLLIVWCGSISDARDVLANLSVDILISRGVHISAHPVTPAEYDRIAARRTAFYEAVDWEGLVVA